MFSLWQFQTAFFTKMKCQVLALRRILSIYPNFIQKWPNSIHTIAIQPEFSQFSLRCFEVEASVMRFLFFFSSLSEFHCFHLNAEIPHVYNSTYRAFQDLDTESLPCHCTQICSRKNENWYLFNATRLKVYSLDLVLHFTKVGDLQETDFKKNGQDWSSRCHDNMTFGPYYESSFMNAGSYTSHNASW